MKPADCICKIDKLGRVLIPKTLRTRLELCVDDPIELFTDGESIMLKKYRKRCTLCGSDEEIIEYKGKYICRNCLDELKSI